MDKEFTKKTTGAVIRIISWTATGFLLSAGLDPETITHVLSTVGLTEGSVQTVATSASLGVATALWYINSKLSRGET